MKLVCFSNNTAGGLVCDLLNNHTSGMSGYKTTNVEHSAFKVGDSPTVQWTVDHAVWSDAVNRNKESNLWMGTHLHPSGIPDISIFNNVISITTMTRQSKLYRWLRYYHGWFKTAHPEWRETDDLADIDRIRELAKNVFEEFTPYPGCENIEFSDIVNGTFVDSHNLSHEHFNHWLKSNTFLNYSPDSWAYQRFYEAEWELTHNKPYRYI